MTHKKRRQQTQNSAPTPIEDVPKASEAKLKRKKKADADRNNDANGYSSTS